MRNRRSFLLLFLFIVDSRNGEKVDLSQSGGLSVMCR